MGLKVTLAKVEVKVEAELGNIYSLIGETIGVEKNIYCQWGTPHILC